MKNRHKVYFVLLLSVLLVLAARFNHLYSSAYLQLVNIQLLNALYPESLWPEQNKHNLSNLFDGSKLDDVRRDSLIEGGNLDHHNLGLMMQT